MDYFLCGISGRSAPNEVAIIKIFVLAVILPTKKKKVRGKTIKNPA